MHLHSPRTRQQSEPQFSEGVDNPPRILNRPFDEDINITRRTSATPELKRVRPNEHIARLMLVEHGANLSKGGLVTLHLGLVRSFSHQSR